MCWGAKVLRRRMRRSSLAAIAAIPLIAASAMSQAASNITADASLGTSVAAPVAITGGMRYDISSGTVAGSNQFHSFENLSVGTGDVARFNGPVGIANVISRVTGGSVSAIDGTIASTIAGANVFLLNPAGVMFGPNAQISVGGAFHASTAGYLRLADGERFYADPAQASTLTTAAPAAFGFLDANPAGISVQGNGFSALPSFTPPAGTDISLVGGEVTVSASILYAPLGRINIAAVGPGSAAGVEAVLTAGAIDVDAFDTLGPVSIGGGSFIDTSALYIRGGQITVSGAYLSPGVGAFVFNLPPPGGHVNNGMIDIRARGDLNINPGASGTLIGSVLQNILVAPIGAGNGPTVLLEAGETLSIQGMPGVQFATIIGTDRWQTGAAGELVFKGRNVEIIGTNDIYALNYASGAGPNITVEAETFTLNGGAINGQTFGPGSGASIQIGSVSDPLGSVRLQGDGAAAQILTSTVELGNGLATGRAGDIEIHTGTLTQIGDTEIGANSFSNGNGGNVTVVASEAVRMSGTNTTTASVIAAGTADNAFPGTGAGGSVTIVSPLLEISNASITTRTQRASDGGDVDITVGTLVASDSTINSDTFDDGDAGSVMVTADNLTLTDGAQIRSFSGAVNTATGAVLVGSGDAGTVTVTATESLSVSGSSSATNRSSALNTQTRGDGAGGVLTVSAGQLTVGEGGLIAADTGGDGDGGALSVTADSVLVDGGQISSGSGISVAITNGQVDLLGSGDGGDVTVQANNGVTVQNGGRIAASSRGPGFAGDIWVDGGNEVRLIGGSIETESLVSDGGDAKVEATDLVYLNGGRITTSVVGAGGTGGNIDIDPQFVVLQNGSQVIANATNPLAVLAGNITITGNFILISQDSLVQASGPTNAQDGEIIIEGPDGDLARALAQMPESYLEAAGLLKAGCGVGRAGTSTLALSSRGGLPVSPDGYLPSLATGLAVTSAGVARHTQAFDELLALGPGDPTAEGWLLADLGCR